MYHTHLNYWSAEFGMNEIGMNTMFVVFLSIYTFLLIVQAAATTYFWGQEKYLHPLVRLVFYVVLFHWLFCVFKVAFYVHYTFDGTGEWSVNRVGDSFYIVMRSCFVLLLLLLASGYSIAESGGTLRDKRSIFCTVAILTIVWILLQIWENHIVPREEVGLHTHIRVLLNILLVTWLFVGGLFCWLSRNSYHRVPTNFSQSHIKKDFFLRLGIFYGLWFLAYPVIILIAQVLDPWVRLKLVTAFTLIETLIGVSVLMYFMWPTRASQYFDFRCPRSSAGAGLRQLG